MHKDEKQALRQTICKQRLKLTEEQQTFAAKRVLEHVLNNDLLTNVEHIAFYFAHRGELNPQPIITHAWQQHKHCYLPVLNPTEENSLFFAPYTMNTVMQTNRYGIAEPSVKNKIGHPTQTLDLVFLPLVAFDQASHRLGMGKGYYDRTFAFRKETSLKQPRIIGLAYEFQKVTHVPHESWDIPLDAVITEETIYWRK